MSAEAPSIEVRVHPTRSDVAAAVAEALVDRLAAVQAAVVDRPARVVLTGGTIADEVHRTIAAAPGNVDWSRVEFWFGDERYVGSTDADRNSLQARTSLLTPLGVPSAHIHEPPATETGLDVHAAAEAFATEFPDGDFDLVLLGMGPDGHTASLFPGRTDVLSSADALGVEDSPKPPPARVTMTVPRLSRTPEIWFVAAGADKADAVTEALTTGVDVVAVPAAAPHGRDLTVWWLDRAAAAFL
jgi:6-phosphogluconolactonase